MYIYIVVDWQWTQYFNGTLQECQRWVTEHQTVEEGYAILVKEFK